MTHTLKLEKNLKMYKYPIDSEYDILVGIFWKRIGTPTKREKSRTVEEIYTAIDNVKKRYLLFKTTPLENLNLIDLEQLDKINLFIG